VLEAHSQRMQRSVFGFNDCDLAPVEAAKMHSAFIDGTITARHQRVCGTRIETDGLDRR